MNDANKETRDGGFLGVVRAIEQVEQLAGDARVYVYEFGLGAAREELSNAEVATIYNKLLAVCLPRRETLGAAKGV